jgi:hypothetical protein
MALSFLPCGAPLPLLVGPAGVCSYVNQAGARLHSQVRPRRLGACTIPYLGADGQPLIGGTLSHGRGESAPQARP